MTELVVRTIHRNTKPETFKLTVLDNGSTKETRDMLRRLKDEGLIDILILWDDNNGLEAARQEMLMHYTSTDYFVDIDNDCLPPPIDNGYDWLERQVNLMEYFETYAAISQRTQVMIGTGNIFEKADEDDDLVLPFPWPGGSFRIMRTAIALDIGGWDREASGRGSEEKYICGKLHEAGYDTGFAVKIQCLHLFGTRDKGHETDRWGYDKDMAPADSGHSNIWHPALGAGDEPTEVYKYAGKELTQEYFDVDRSS
jgi:glycosyltransferase involved in cell wall biosynthesis